jgi:hypothetical protein
VSDGDKTYAQAKEHWLLGNFMLALKAFRAAVKSATITAEKKLRAIR